MARPLAVAGTLALAAAGLSACQSTQSRSAALEKEGGTKLLTEAGLKIKKENSDIKVTSTDLLSDRNGSAVVVGVHNSSEKNLVNVPILIEVFDGKGKKVYSNDIPGIEQALAAVPYIPAGGDAKWVNDQVLSTSKPKSVKVKVGASSDTYSGPLPEVEVSSPTLEGDPVSGLEATGDVVNKSGEEQERLLIYAIATSGGRVIAAGRGALEHLKAKTKPVHYDIFFIGDPKGADVEMIEYPTLPGYKAE